MLCHVSVHSGAFCLRHRARDPIACARLSDSISSGNVLKAKLRRARLGKGGGGGGILLNDFPPLSRSLEQARDPISVAFFDRVALFSDFNHLFELLDQVLLPIAVGPFIYWNYAQKTF